MASWFNVRFDTTGIDTFEAKCMGTIHNTVFGTKAAATEMAKTIYNRSQEEVPKGTFTLASSGYWKVNRRTDISGYRYEAEIGYGGNGDPVNPRTGQPASQYMVEVHEDLNMVHLIGKAKFLEDPVRDYGNYGFEETFARYMLDAIWMAK